MSRLKIFVSAYACEPNLGSEIGVGWHWVLEMSKYFELWVLTRESNRCSIETWMLTHPEYTGVHFLYFDLPKWARFWKKGLRGVRLYYNLWQSCTDSIVKRTMQENEIEIFHHLTYGNLLWKVSRYGQRKFFIWGPVGGLETIPEEYSCRYSKKAQWLERIRRVAVTWAKRNSRFRTRCRRADLILCKTEITLKNLPEKDQTKAILFTDVAAELAGRLALKIRQRETTRFITVGKLDAWRGFDLILEAMKDALNEGVSIHLTIVGKGQDESRLRALIHIYGLTEVVTLTGAVPMQVYKQLMEDADAVINAALKEGAVTVSFDSLALGKPLLCLDTTGYTRCFSDECAILIPLTSRREVIEGLKRGMIRLTDAEERSKLGRRAQKMADKLSWEKHGRQIREIIEKTYYKHE